MIPESSTAVQLFEALQRPEFAAAASRWLAANSTLLLIAARLAGLTTFLPALLRGIGWTMRIGLVLALTFAVAPLTGMQEHAAVGAWELARLAACEFALGGALSTTVGVVLGGVRLAGEIVDQQLGLTLSEGLALGGEGGAGIASTVLRSLAVLTFLQIGGHLFVVRACADSLRAIPVGTYDANLDLGWWLTVLIQQSFVLALRLAGPIWGATALASLGWTLLSRAVGPLSGTSLGAPVRACVGLLALAATLPLVADVVSAAVPTSVERFIDEGLGADRPADSRERRGRSP